jgi:2-iminobutanoate/2-iminopropanoate deaminase
VSTNASAHPAARASTAVRGPGTSTSSTINPGALVAGGVSAQTAQAVENLKAQLASMGATVADVAKTLCFLTDMDTFATFNEAYVAGFGDSRPARSTIGVASLPFGGAVEIEAWAFKPLG